MTALDNLPPQQQGIINAAIALVQSGCTVIPTKKDGGKAPAVSWKQYQENPPTAEEIIKWFVIDQHTGIGIITGKASGNLEMIELEGRAVQAGIDQELEQLAYAAGLEELWDRIWSGWTEQSPSGGVHWFIRISDGIVPGNTKLAVNVNNEVLAETRGEGGFVVTAPSYGNVHETGNEWFILEGGPSTIATVTYEERNAFINLFKSLSHHKPTEAKETKPVTEPTGDRPGDQWALVTPWEHILEPHGWRKIFTTSTGVTHWRRPGKDTGTSATTGYSDTGNLYVFSTNAHPFEGEASYSKFAAHTYLNHGGDFAAASRDLAAQGYGTPQPANELKPLNQLTTAPIYKENEPQEEGEAEESTWKPVNLTAYLDGTYTRPDAAILYRQDGPGLLYPGRVHSFYGESESGKSWLAQIATAATLTTGGTAIYIDFEADAHDIVKRLTLLGVTRQQFTNLTYIRPEAARSETDPYWHQLLASRPQLVIVDGVTESLTMWGGETKDNDGITRWMRLFPRTVSDHTNAAVVTIDHVAKDKESRGRFAIGGQAKLAAIDGAAYLIEPASVLAPGQIGRLKMNVTKDRPGSIRAISGQWRKDRIQDTAEIVLDATGPQLTYEIERYKTEEEVAEFRKEKVDQLIFDYIKQYPYCSMSNLEDGVRGDDKYLRQRLYALMERGYIENKGKGGKGNPFVLVTTHAGDNEFAGQLRNLDEVI